MSGGFVRKANDRRFNTHRRPDAHFSQSIESRWSKSACQAEVGMLVDSRFRAGSGSAVRLTGVCYGIDVRVYDDEGWLNDGGWRTRLPAGPLAVKARN